LAEVGALVRRRGGLLLEHAVRPEHVGQLVAREDAQPLELCSMRAER
jgi:hypothetical protein